MVFFAQNALKAVIVWLGAIERTWKVNPQNLLIQKNYFLRFFSALSLRKMPERLDYCDAILATLIFISNIQLLSPSHYTRFAIVLLSCRTLHGGPESISLPRTAPL